MKDSIQKLLGERYLLRTEKTWDDIAERVGGIYPEVTDLIRNMNFIPSTPTLMNGNTKGVRKGTLSSCFPMGIDDNMEGIFSSLKEAALVTKGAGGIGYNFSKLRSSGEVIQTLDGRNSSGPMPFINCFNAMLDGIRQGGARKGAGMAMLDIEHPDILTFITAKRDWKKQNFNRFNFSVRIPNSFYKNLKEKPNSPMLVKEVITKKQFELTNEQGEIITVKQLWDMILESAWASAEPGIFNSDIAYDQCSVTNYSQDVLANPCCLTKDTLINTNKGPMLIIDIAELKNINDIKVLSYNPYREEFSYENIDNAWLAKEDAELVEIECEDGRTIKLTADHLILTKNGWIEAGDLTPNDEIISNY